VIEVLTNPNSAGQGGKVDEPLLLVRKLAADETDAIFGDFGAKYFPKYFQHVAHTGTWSPLPGGFNRWVENYHRTALNGARPVLVTVHVSTASLCFAVASTAVDVVVIVFASAAAVIMLW